jgi:alpha-1,6-mannosyltransferase
MTLLTSQSELRQQSEGPVEDVPARTWPAGLFVLLGAVGAAGMVVISAAGVTLGAPGPTGSSLGRAVVDLVPGGSADSIVAIVALVLGLCAVAGAWIALGLVVRRGAPLRPLVGIAAAWATPLIFGPPIFSRDVYSYAADGLMVSRHLAPNHYGPAALGGSHFVDPVSQVWLYTRSPYGPSFLRIAGWTVPLSHYSLLGTVMLLRLVAVFGVVLIGIALPKLASAHGRDPSQAFWLGVCNPLVLIHFIAGAHNDALMVGLMVAGLALAASKRPVAGLLVCVVAATVKAPAAIAAVFIIAEVVHGLPPNRRLGALVRLTGISIAGFVTLTWATQLGWGWLGALGVPGVNRSLLTPATFFAYLVSKVIGHDATVLNATRLLALLLSAVGVGYLVWRAPKIGTVRACALALALVVALGPVVLPWYALWAIVVIAAGGDGIERGYAVVSSVILLAVLEPSGSTMPDLMLMITVVVLLGIAFAVSYRPVRRWIQDQLPSVVERYRRSSDVLALWLTAPAPVAERLPSV